MSFEGSGVDTTERERGPKKSVEPGILEKERQELNSH